VLRLLAKRNTDIGNHRSWTNTGEPQTLAHAATVSPWS
jgi:hypothetical protein